MPRHLKRTLTCTFFYKHAHAHTQSERKLSNVALRVPSTVSTTPTPAGLGGKLNRIVHY